MINEYQNKETNTKQLIKANIEKFGCHVVLLESNNYLSEFAYSIGLFEKYHHPEIICFGLDLNTMQSILNHICDLIKEGQKFKINKLYDNFLEDYPVQFIEVQNEFYSNYAEYAGSYYPNFDFPLLQIVWPDAQKKFPWETEFNIELKFKQPLLDRNIDFKFHEEQNLGVFTTKQVLDGESILFVYHDEDGDWQFHSNSESNIDDARLVCLFEIVKIDKSINEIYHLPYGYKAWRTSFNAKWKYAKK